MGKHLGRILIAVVVASLCCVQEIKAETGYIGPSSTSPAPEKIIPSANKQQVSDNSTQKSSAQADGSSKSKDKLNAQVSAKIAHAGQGSNAAGVGANVQSASVQVEPSSGSAGLSIPIAVPAGRAGIQPNLAVVYNSGNRQLGNAGVGWNLDVGSIRYSTKNGVLLGNYGSSRQIFTMEHSGAIEDMVVDPNNSSLYHMEVEGAFASIQFFNTYWLVTDKKGTKYYYGIQTIQSKCPEVLFFVGR